MLIACEVEPPAEYDAIGFLGVDLGQVNLAVDSDGEIYSGEPLRRRNERLWGLQDRLRSVGSSSARHHLKELFDYERRFHAEINHCISKKIIVKAKGTHRAIALEDLKGIRERTVVRKAQRRDYYSWGFNQLGRFIKYKAELAGVPFILVEPRYTSQTCPKCGFVHKYNRVSQSEFVCRSCGFADHADHVGAVNIASRGEVGRPIASREFRSQFGQSQMQALAQ